MTHVIVTYAMIRYEKNEDEPNFTTEYLNIESIYSLLPNKHGLL